MKLNIILWVLILNLISLCARAQKSEFRIVGYYSLNSSVEKKDIKRAAFKKLTHINLWFLNPDSLGKFTRDFSSLAAFINKAHHKNVKVLFSIGGGTKQSQYHALLKDDKRAVFINALVSEVLKYNVDGIDVDLEGSDIDENYEDFVIELAHSLRNHKKLITSAIAVYYKDQLTDLALAQFDFVNIMSYDRTGPWRPEKPGPHSTYEHALEDLEYFGSVRKIPKEKMTLGVPFYGYGYGPEISSPAISMNFGRIVSSFQGAELVDQWTMPNGKTIYYNGIPTIKRKAALAKEKTSGIMIWQVLGDAQGSKSLLKALYKVGQGK
ncbi:MAG: hypothetical protein JJE09_10040 [Bacteroidia bacterium]|nr:hypothetical protein [Bacteroidia bacterium]